MFGQQNNDNENQQIPEQSIDGALQQAPAQDETPQETPSQDAQSTDTAAVVSTQDVIAPNTDDTSWQHPGMPLDPAKAATVAAPAVPKPTYSTPTPSEDTNYTANDLIDIKQKALQQLSPLVGHLDQTPEDKFRTTMMMIQASDDQTLVKDAFAAANAIEDEKIRAQALLDIVNEINYFTTQHPDA
jgi:hypothetical protein